MIPLHVVFIIIYLFIYLSFHLRLLHWLLARANTVSQYLHLFIYLSNWFYTHLCAACHPLCMILHWYYLFIYLSSRTIPGERIARPPAQPCEETAFILFISLFIPSPAHLQPGNTRNPKEITYLFINLFFLIFLGFPGFPGI
jgi:hypothetical protein